MIEVRRVSPELPQRGPRRQPNQKLYGLRLNEGLSRKDLAARCGISSETVRLAELGWTPTPRVQFALAGAFDLRPLDLWPIERQRSLR